MLHFQGRQRSVWGAGYTELFFLDEVTALAAGHRPCFECRRADATAFAQSWAKAKRGSAPKAPEMDVVLQGERLDGRTKRCCDMIYADLPDGAVAHHNGVAYAMRGDFQLRWSETGYVEKSPRPRGLARVLTPPSIVAALDRGYPPQWHPSAGALF